MKATKKIAAVKTGIKAGIEAAKTIPAPTGQTLATAIPALMAQGLGSVVAKKAVPSKADKKPAAKKAKPKKAPIVPAALALTIPTKQVERFFEEVREDMADDWDIPEDKMPFTADSLRRNSAVMGAFVRSLRAFVEGNIETLMEDSELSDDLYTAIRNQFRGELDKIQAEVRAKEEAERATRPQRLEVQIKAGKRQEAESLLRKHGLIA